jgi:hypothetical protein
MAAVDTGRPPVKLTDETHHFLHMLVCDWCGHKVTLDATARSVMRDHLAAHPQSRFAPPSHLPPDYPYSETDEERER